MKKYDSSILLQKKFLQGTKEYRIITSHPVEGDSLTVNLGDISDIVLNLESADTLKNLK